MKRILFIEQNDDGTIGGSHYCLLYLIQELDRSRYEPVTMFYENNPLIQKFDAQGKTVVFNKTRYFAKGGIVFKKGANLLLTLWNIGRCCSFIRGHRIDLVHLNNSVTTGYDMWLIASILSGIPCISHERAFAKREEFQSLSFRFLSKRFKKVLTVSNVVRDNLIRNGLDSDKVVTVYDGIDVKKYHDRVRRTRAEVVKEFGISSDTFLIGLVGNIREWKGQELLIDALNILKKEVDNFTCLLIGDVSKNSDEDAKFKNRLIEKISGFNLSGKVIFTGYRSDVPDLMNALDVQINPSIEPDPFPHVVLEGMALGKVVIATGLGGARESIDDGETGFVVSATDPGQLADKIGLVLQNENLRKSMGDKAKIRVETYYSLEKNVENTQKIYSNLLNA